MDIDPFDAKVAAAIEWAPHGGGTALEIDAAFSMTEVAFYRHVLALIRTDEYRRRLPDVVLERLTDIARYRMQSEN
ncbi:hypothetical protein [Rhodococcoides fascians]|uniref:hypothetical protein n=1 Tax=Rhodococcoides fascians TaxID=1828 RepID=UPI00050C627E|nr:hypothetical protein [Rhodococcus fascians]